jgi:hypothetical protein
MKIEAYKFGTITIDGIGYKSDLKIIAGQVVPDWWRKEGHNLLPVDIQDILKAGPEVLVVGKGDPGMMTVSDELRTLLNELGIELFARPSPEACDAFNRISPTRDTAFAVHLTC